VIRIRDLCYRYPGQFGWVLRDLNLDVEAGETVLVCGASGSGKSTLCRTLNGLIPHFHRGEMKGSVHVAGMDTRQYAVAELFAHVAMVFQNPEAQLFNSTVERELAFGLESAGFPGSEIRRRIAEAAEMAQIAALLERTPHRLSGGEQQLVVIASALALRPEIIVLDEPYANLDPLSVGRVRAALRQAQQRGTTVVLAEHRLEETAADADRMVVLHRGRVVLCGAPEDVLGKDVTRFGLNPPPVVRLARDLNLPQTPLSIEGFAAAVEGQALDPALLPARPAVPVGGERMVLEVEELTFAFDGTPVLAGVDLSLNEGESVALVGANGSGKTTLIKHFNGLYRPQCGRVLVLGQDTGQAQVSRLARHVGMAFQNANNQFFTFRVRDEIEVGARALGRYDPDWLEELVHLFHLEELLDRSPYQISEGEKKRVAFAAALSARPEIVVLDEPTTGQDWAFRQSLGHLLESLQTREQTIVLVTHDLGFAERHAGRWLALAGGRIVDQGHPWEVMSHGEAMRRAGLEPTQSFRLHSVLRDALRARSPSTHGVRM